MPIWTIGQTNLSMSITTTYQRPASATLPTMRRMTEKEGGDGDGDAGDGDGGEGGDSGDGGE